MAKKVDFEIVPPNGWLIHRPEAWTIEHYQYNKGADFKGLRDILRNEKFSVKSSKLNHRVMNLWTKSGIFPDRRHDDMQWRKLNFVDLAWARVLVILRGYGLSMDLLKLSYETVTYAYGQKGFPVNYFEFGVAGCLSSQQFWLLVFEDGWTEVVTNREIELSEIVQPIGGTSHIKLNLNAVVKQVFPNIPEPTDRPINVSVNSSELEILTLMRLGELNQLDIYLEDGVIWQLDKYIEENVDISPDDIIKKIQFGELTIKRRDGKNQRIVRKGRIKL